eukprot:scaffold1304_cov82-Cylindrotheca_fusiformis.AAC.4
MALFCPTSIAVGWRICVKYSKKESNQKGRNDVDGGSKKIVSQEFCGNGTLQFGSVVANNAGAIVATCSDHQHFLTYA